MSFKPADSSYPPDVDPGELIHRITFLDQVIGNDASGASVSYAPGNPAKQAWARIKWLRGTDVIKAGQDVSQAFAEVTIRYRQDVSASQRIQTPSGTVLIVQAMQNVREMNMWLALRCIAVGNNDA